MRLSQLLALAGLAGGAAARRPTPLRDGATFETRDFGERPFTMPEENLYRRSGASIVEQTAKTAKYAVNGTAIPDVHFDIGESYAGLMPVYGSIERSFYFWFFPSANKDASDEIVIWLNGGPGCSSLEGLLQENGPFLWQYGTFQPVKNPWTWQKLSNVVWVEQPVGTGFSQGKVNGTSEEDVARDFLSFWKNFEDTFNLHNRKVYITGESYAGYYVPYIASAMLDQKDTKYYDVEGIMIYDPSTSYHAIQDEIPTIPFLQYHQNLFHINDTYMSHLTQRDEACGYKAFREKYLAYPPPGPLPQDINSMFGSNCDVYSDAMDAISLLNPCYDVYQVATTCPLLWDVLGFPGSFTYSPAGAPDIYFDRPEVQRAINAPVQRWAECQHALNGDSSPPSGVSVLPGVIERTNRTVIGHGQLDMILIANGTLLMIQNMTWNGKQGFQTKPSTPFLVPYHAAGADGTLAGAGRFGTTHTERGLTWVEVYLSGHMIPQYAPSASYRTLEFLLGRIDSLNDGGSFSTL